MSRIEEIEKRLLADPNSRMFVQLAEEYRKEGLLDNAVEVCEAGLKKHPHYPSARVALGRALLESESYQRAAEQFETVLSEVPENILANKFLGETYHRLGRFDEALQKYQIAQTLAPEDTELEGKIQAVRDEVAGDAPGPLASAEAVPALPIPVTGEPDADRPPFGAPSAAGSLPEPPSEDVLEATMVDPPAAAPPPLPAAPEWEAPAETFLEGNPLAADEPEQEPEADLAPIPLVDVSEPMVLEGPAYIAAEKDIVQSEPVAPVSEASLTPPQGEQIFEIPDDDPEPIAPLPPKEATHAPEVSAVFDSTPVETPFAQEGLAPFEPDVVEPRAPAPPIPAAEPASRSAPLPDEIETPTMAELYASQGHFERATAVYKNLLVRTPNETQYEERIAELEMLADAAVVSKDRVAPAQDRPAGGDSLSSAAKQKTAEILDEWLDAIRRSREA